ncbi:MAG: 3'(2'),5'-bisphosphate nucleotidase CysQ [Halobacteriales archaeon]|nr:3'(2'),5'-bisphosphate nucleotidase CysQ [Halobacteriales archaeon]
MAEDVFAALLPLVRRAGQAILAVERKGWTVTAKPDRSPLTEADTAAHRVLAAGLPAVRDVPVLSEEAEVPELGARFWAVDPLDGTKEFLKRNGEYTVNVALVEHGAPILGVVHAPASGVVWWGAPGAGAWRDDGQGAAVVRVAPPGAAVRVAVSRSHLDPATERFLAALGKSGPVEVVPLGSSLKFCRIAEGALDLYPRFGPTMCWDTAAAQAVLEAAGGMVRRLDGAPLRCQGPDLRNPSFLAASGPVAGVAEALAAARSVA